MTDDDQQVEAVPPGRTGFARYLPRAHPISWTMLGVTTGAILITSIDRGILPAVLPAIQTEYGLDDQQAGRLVSLSFVGTAIGGLAIGVFGDSLGKGARRAWSWAIAVVIVVISAVATAFGRSIGQLQVFRVIMGIGTGGMEPVNVTMVGEWWQKENRGFAVGTHHTGFPIGQFVGLLLIGAVVGIADWRAAFLFIPLIALPIVVVQVVIARRRNLRAVNEWITEQGMTPSLTEADLDEERTEHPLRTAWKAVKGALAERNVRLAVLVNFLFLFAEAGVVTFLTVQLTRDVGLSPALAITVSGASGITGWIGQIFWGTLSDHLGRKFSLSILAVGWAVTVSLMIFIDSLTLAWVILIAWGLFRNSPFPVMYASIIDAVPSGASSGLGIMIGVGLGLSGIAAGLVGGTVVQTYGFTVHYLVIAGVCLLALIPIAMLRETSKGAAG